MRWWQKKTWTLREIRSDPGGEENELATRRKTCSTDYLEDTEGAPITEDERRTVYSHAHLIWNSFASTGRPPAGYKQVSIQYLTRYHEEMEKEFPILRLCARHWKADQIWILNYPSWLRNWEIKTQRSKDKTIKSELRGDDDLSLK